MCTIGIGAPTVGFFGTVLVLILFSVEDASHALIAAIAIPMTLFAGFILWLGRDAVI